MSHLPHLREAGMRAAAEESLHGPCSPSGPTHETSNGGGLEELVTRFGCGMGQENQDPNLDSCHRRHWSLWALNQTLSNIKWNSNTMISLENLTSAWSKNVFCFNQVNSVFGSLTSSSSKPPMFVSRQESTPCSSATQVLLVRSCKFLFLVARRSWKFKLCQFTICCQSFSWMVSIVKSGKGVLETPPQFCKYSFSLCHHAAGVVPHRGNDLRSMSKATTGPPCVTCLCPCTL